MIDALIRKIRGHRIGVKICIAAIFLGLLIVNPSWAIINNPAPDQIPANSIYVSPSGNDRGNGTQSSPYQSLVRAVRAVQPGGTIFMMPGTYYPFSEMVFTKPGTASAPITVRGNGQATLDGSRMMKGRDILHISREGFRNHDMYWIIDGVNVVNAPRAGIRINWADHVTLRYLEVGHNGKWGVFSNHSNYVHVHHVEAHHSRKEHGIYLSNSGDNHIVENNIFHHNNAAGAHFNGDASQGGDGIVSNMIVRNNIAYENGSRAGGALNFDGVMDSQIFNNLIYGNHKHGITIYARNGARSGNNIITHNTIYFEPKEGSVAFLLKNGTFGNRVTNNIIFVGTGLLVEVDAQSSTKNNVVDYNAYYNFGGRGFSDNVIDTYSFEQWRKLFPAFDRHSFMVNDPNDVFASLAKQDFRQKQRSPTVDAGSDVYKVDVDMAGKARPQGSGYDIGAFELKKINVACRSDTDCDDGLSCTIDRCDSKVCDNLKIDADGDGYNICDGPHKECNDDNDAIFPGAVETCGDGIDYDCDGLDSNGYHLGEKCGGTGNLALGKIVTASRSDWGNFPQSMVDGVWKRGSWTALGTPNWVDVDLGSKNSITEIRVAPHNNPTNSGKCYYNRAWNIKYKGNDDSVWRDFTNVVMQQGAGTLLSGISVGIGNERLATCDERYERYVFTFNAANARFVRYEVTSGDGDGDSNGQEIEVYGAGRIGTLACDALYSTVCTLGDPVLAPEPSLNPDLTEKTVFPMNNIWNTPIDNLPIDPNSDAYINSMAPNDPLIPDFGAGIYHTDPNKGGPIGIPFVMISGDQPRVNINFTRWATQSDPGPYPIPRNPPIEGGPDSTFDRHVLVVDRDNWVLYELYKAFPNSDGSWNASNGAIFDLKVNGPLRPERWTSTDAAGLPVFPGLIRHEELASGEIKHAIRFTTEKTRKAYVWPARHWASSITDMRYPPMGQRFRLKADYDISGFTPQNQIILRALKKYGIILADNGGNWWIQGGPNPRWNDSELHELRLVRGSDFEAVDVLDLMIHPDSGEAKQNIVPRRNQSTAAISRNVTQQPEVLQKTSH